MSKFLTGTDLEEAIYNIIWDAEKVLLIVSPFIRLDGYFKKLFDKHVNNPAVHIILVFGKNEGEVKKSMSKQDFEYFKKFPFVSIVYVPNLHAKYYGNDKQGVITSVNLYDYSFKNNVEFGVFSEVGFFDKFTNNTDQDAWSESMKIAETNEAIFIKRPVYQHKKLLVSLGKNYVKSDVLLDRTNIFNGRNIQGNNIPQTLKEFPKELELGTTKYSRPHRSTDEQLVEAISVKSKITSHRVIPITQSKLHKTNTSDGFCLRCHDSIRISVDKPYCHSCFSIWSKYENPDFTEKYCHSCGKQHNSTMNKPECYDCYKHNNRRKVVSF